MCSFCFITSSTPRSNPVVDEIQEGRGDNSKVLMSGCAGNYFAYPLPLCRLCAFPPMLDKGSLKDIPRC